MATTNMCNQFDFVCNGRVVYKGAQFTEYEEVEQPKPEEPEEKKFDGSSLTGKVLGAVVAAGCVAAAFGLVAAWGVSAFFSGGATAAAAPLVWQAAAFCLAAAPIAWGAGNAISEQYNQDMAGQKDGEWGTYAKLSIIDPVVVGAQDIVIGAVVGSALAGAARLGSKLMGKMFPRKAKEIVNSLQRRAANLRANMPNSKLANRGNVATAEVNIPGCKKEYIAHSSIDEITDKGADVADLSLLKGEDKRIFTTYVEDKGYSRYHDTEAKILEDIASKIKDQNVKGTINLYTEKPTCQSCANVILEFRRIFPNIKLNVFTND